VNTIEVTDDVILRNGTVIDGTGRPAYVADLAIRGDRIAQIGRLEQLRAVREIDVEGQVVAPGFYRRPHSR
jgi:N-acyl-D-amino-acid deacylase